MDNVAWDRCPDCLGLLDAVETSDGVALGCRTCGHIGPAEAVEDVGRPTGGDGVAGLEGF